MERYIILAQQRCDGQDTRTLEQKSIDYAKNTNTTCQGRVVSMTSSAEYDEHNEVVETCIRFWCAKHDPKRAELQRAAEKAQQVAAQAELEIRRLEEQLKEGAL